MESFGSTPDVQSRLSKNFETVLSPVNEFLFSSIFIVLIFSNIHFQLTFRNRTLFVIDISYSRTRELFIQNLPALSQQLCMVQLMATVVVALKCEVGHKLVFGLEIRAVEKHNPLCFRRFCGNAFATEPIIG